MSIEKVTAVAREALGAQFSDIVVTEFDDGFHGEAKSAVGDSISFALIPPGSPKEPQHQVYVREDARNSDLEAGDRVEAALNDIGREVFAPTVESLDALPDDSVVQVVERSLWRLGEDAFHESYSYFQKFGRGWLELDPGDRYDGESLEDSAFLLAKANHFGSKGETLLPGSVRTLFVPPQR